MRRRREEIVALRLRVASALVLRACLEWFFVWTMIWATAVVVLRVAVRAQPPMLVWGALGYIAAAALAFTLARRRFPAPAVVRAVLDRHAAMGGLVMAAGETDIGPWDGRVLNVPRPAVRFQARRHCGMLLCAAALLAAGFLMPDSYLPSSSGETLHLDDEIQQLAKKVQLLEKERIVPPEKAEAEQKALEQAQQNASGRDPAKTMEAIDHLQQSLNKTAEEAQQEAMKTAEAAAEVEQVAAALEKCQQQMDPKLFNEAMKQLAQMADQAAGDCKQLGQEMSKELQNACRNCKLSSKQLKELANACKNCKACQRGKICKMCQGRLIDAAKLGQCDKNCKKNCEELAFSLGKCKNCDDVAGLLENCRELLGRGGPGGGGPPAPMIWSEGAETKGVAFKEKTLSPSQIASLKESRLTGVSSGSPTAKPSAGQGSTGGALNPGSAGAGSASTQVILPEHRKAVSRYFKREKQ